MKIEEKIFEVDYSKLNFRIGIDVCENGSLLYIFDVTTGYKITYHTLIGVIETLKASFIQQQKDKNIKSETQNPDLKEAQVNFENALREFKFPNDLKVGQSLLSTRIKNCIADSCTGGKYGEYHTDIFFNKRFDDLMLSDIAQINNYRWFKIRNFGKHSLNELNKYLSSVGFEKK